MILHLLTDEQFTDYAVTQFSAQKIESDFVLIPSYGHMHYVKQIDKCRVVLQYSQEYADLLTNLGKYSGIIFYGMFSSKWQTPILKQVPPYVKVAWYFFGGDIYTRRGLDDFFLAPITKSLYTLHGRKTHDIHSVDWEIPIELYKRVNYCLTSEYEEYEFAKQYTNSDFKFLWYTCYSIEETIGSLINEHCVGDNVWIGNSAAIENNHLDVLWFLWKKGLLRQLKRRQVIVPMSYGNPWVRNLLKRVGRIVLGKKMRALETYMPRNEYNQLMLSCSTMIIGYWEPAAQGNIITGLWLGMRVYISEKNMTYAFFKRIGAKVFSIEKELPKYGYMALPEEDRATNREALKKWYSKEHVEQAVKEVVNELR